MEIIKKQQHASRLVITAKQKKNAGRLEAAWPIVVQLVIITPIQEENQMDFCLERMWLATGYP